MLDSYAVTYGYCFMGTSKNLLRDPISGLRCSPYIRTAPLLGPTLSRSLRFLEVPFYYFNTITAALYIITVLLRCAIQTNLNQRVGMPPRAIHILGGSARRPHSERLTQCY